MAGPKIIFRDDEIIFETDDADELRRYAKRCRRTAKNMMRRAPKRGGMAQAHESSEQSFLRLAEAAERAADALSHRSPRRAES